VRRGSLRWALAVVGAVGISGCTIREMRLRPDYDKVDKFRVKRLSIVTSPLPDGSQAGGDLFSLMARRQVNLKRQFIAKDTAAMQEGFEPRARCKGGIEGVMWLKPNAKRFNKSVTLNLDAKLYRCIDGAVVWEASGGGRWAEADDTLKEMTATYVSELGPEAEPFVAPAFHMMKALVDQMPDPVLTEEDKDEKIELGD